MPQIYDMGPTDDQNVALKSQLYPLSFQTYAIPPLYTESPVFKSLNLWGFILPENFRYIQGKI